MNEYRLKKSGFAIRYLDLPGTEPPLVILHGLGCASSYEYPPLTAQPQLIGRRAILIDLLGAGYSDRPADFPYTVEEHAAYLHEMLTALSLNDIVLIGHSLGGAVAICLSVLLGDKLRQLILLESNLDPSPTGATSKRIASSSEEAFLARGYAQMLAQAQRKNARLAATFVHWLPEAAWRISRSAARGGTPSWRQSLYDLSKPKAFLIGADTRPKEDAEALATHGVRVEIIPSAGHSMALDNPRALAGVIADLIASVTEANA